MAPSVPSPAGAAGEPRRVRITYEVEEQPERWLLDEEDMPESTLHDQVIDLLKLILTAWAAREKRAALVARNIACRWDPADRRVGTDPDIALVEPAPPGCDDLGQLRVWEPGHHPPRVAVEVVSSTTADKDYLEAPARNARLGTRELWVFDPKREGPADTGGPFALQIWQQRGAEMHRVYAGAGPARSEELGAFLVVTDGGTRLRLADDAEGARLWLTEAEEQARRADSAEREIEALRRKLADLGGG